MGYRSDVAFSIRGKKDDVIAHLTAFRIAGGVHEKTAISACRYTEDREVLVISFEEQSTKWYESYPEVGAIRALFDWFADDEDERFDCAFMRIGEEDDDVETLYRGDDPYSLVRVVRTYEMEHLPQDGVKLEEILCAASTS